MNPAITLYGLSRWGKSRLARGGDFNVAVDLARAQGTNRVYVGGFDEAGVIDELRGLYPDIDFVHVYAAGSEIEKMVIVNFDLRVAAAEIEFPRFEEFTRRSDRVLLNIMRQPEYYAELVEARPYALGYVASMKSIILHDESLAYDYGFADIPQKSFGQIIFYDPTNEVEFGAVKKEIMGTRDSLSFSFGRPSRFKGAHLWLDYIKRRPDGSHVMQSPLSNTSSVMALINDDETRSQTYADLKSHKMPDRALVEAPYNVSDQKFIDFCEHSNTSLVCHDYNFMGGEYAVIEYTQLEAVYNGLRLQWIEDSLRTMHSRSSQFDATHISLMDIYEQRKLFSERFNANAYYEKVKAECESE